MAYCNTNQYKAKKLLKSKGLMKQIEEIFKASAHI